MKDNQSLEVSIVHANEWQIPSIMEIIYDAQVMLAEKKIDQWQNGYPNEEAILKDVFANESFILINNEDQIMATAMFTTREEPTYKVIEGKWKTPMSNIYGVIHRLAVAKMYRKQGWAKYMINYFEEELQKNGIASMRVDTHEDNAGMQRLLDHLGYEYCGIIKLTTGHDRLAFEKVLIKD